MPEVQLLAFALAVGVLIVMPGADFAVVLRNGMAGGRSCASATGLGIAAGLLMWTVAVATGLGALLAASATAYLALKLAGVAYLVYLGVRFLWSSFRGSGGVDSDSRRIVSAPSPRQAFVQGLLTNALNPKVALTFLALMPQFLPPQPTAHQFLLLSGLQVLMATAWFQLVAVVVSAFRSLFARTAVRRALEAVTGTVLLGFGLRLAADPGP